MLSAHPRLPFECTYHFIRVGPKAFVLLDVIRSPQGNSLRFFVVQDEQLQHHEVIDESSGGGAALAPTGDHIKRSTGTLHFDITFVVKKSACAVAPINPARLFAITAKDHPHVVYNGTIDYQTNTGEPRRWALQEAPGTISQHYGRTLPEYLYLTSYFEEGAPQVVGAISRVSTALGFRITSSYVSLSQPQAAPRTRLSLRPTWQVLPGGHVKVRSRHAEVAIELGNQRLAHEIDHQGGITWFNARVFLPGHAAAPLAALVETRGPGWLEG